MGRVHCSTVQSHVCIYSFAQSIEIYNKYNDIISVFLRFDTHTQCVSVRTMLNRDKRMVMLLRASY